MELETLVTFSVVLEERFYRTQTLGTSTGDVGDVWRYGEVKLPNAQLNFLWTIFSSIHKHRQNFSISSTPLASNQQPLRPIHRGLVSNTTDKTLGLAYRFLNPNFLLAPSLRRVGRIALLSGKDLWASHERKPLVYTWVCCCSIPQSMRHEGPPNCSETVPDCQYECHQPREAIHLFLPSRMGLSHWLVPQERVDISFSGPRFTITQEKYGRLQGKMHSFSSFSTSQASHIFLFILSVELCSCKIRRFIYLLAMRLKSLVAACFASRAVAFQYTPGGTAQHGVMNGGMETLKWLSRQLVLQLLFCLGKYDYWLSNMTVVTTSLLSNMEWVRPWRGSLLWSILQSLFSTSDAVLNSNFKDIQNWHN